jgi:hypothetical protein
VSTEGLTEIELALADFGGKCYSTFGVSEGQLEVWFGRLLLGHFDQLEVTFLPISLRRWQNQTFNNAPRKRQALNVERYQWLSRRIFNLPPSSTKTHE